MLNKASLVPTAKGGYSKGKKDDDPTQIPSSIDINSTFLLPIIPDEVRATVPYLHIISTQLLRLILQQLLEYIHNGNFTDDDSIILHKKIQKELGINDNVNIPILLSGLYTILKHGVAGKIKLSIISNDLQRMNTPQAAIEDICKVILASKSKLEKTLVDKRIRFPRLQKLRWRIDVTISSGSLSRVMRPSILMEMSLSNGSIRTFEVSIDQFNQLRHGVAKVLLDMQTLERHPIMKLVGDIEKRNQIDSKK
jgi:hypothetical protein